MKYRKRSEKQKEAQSTSGQKCGSDSVSEVPVKREKDEDDDNIVLD